MWIYIRTFSIIDEANQNKVCFCGIKLGFKMMIYRSLKHEIGRHWKYLSWIDFSCCWNSSSKTSIKKFYYHFIHFILSIVQHSKPMTFWYTILLHIRVNNKMTFLIRYQSYRLVSFASVCSKVCPSGKFIYLLLM